VLWEYSYNKFVFILLINVSTDGHFEVEGCGENNIKMDIKEIVRI
jgi:hypothetical protein